MATRTMTLGDIVAAGFNREDVLDGASDLTARDYAIGVRTGAMPAVIVDASDNLIDGYHRVLGLMQWAEHHGRDLARVRIRVIEIPDDEGEKWFGRGLTDREATALIAQYATQNLKERTMATTHCEHGNRRDLGLCPACNARRLYARQRQTDRARFRAQLARIRGVRWENP